MFRAVNAMAIKDNGETKKFYYYNDIGLGSWQKKERESIMS